jgi:hypothetical protein
VVMRSSVTPPATIETFLKLASKKYPANATIRDAAAQSHIASTPETADAGSVGRP